MNIDMQQNMLPERYIVPVTWCVKRTLRSTPVLNIEMIAEVCRVRFTHRYKHQSATYHNCIIKTKANLNYTSIVGDNHDKVRE